MTPTDPENEWPADDPADFVIGLQRQPVNSAIAGLDGIPEDAARSLELSQVTGAPPELISGDLENFEYQHKAALTSELVRNNQFLQNYINNNPLASQLSNDDWGQLDAVSQAVQRFQRSRAGQILNLPSSTLAAGAKGFAEGFGQEPMGQWLPTDPKINRLAWAEMTAIGYPMEAAGRVFSGLLEAAHQVTQQVQVAAGADEDAAERRSRELTAIVEAELGGLSGRHPMPEIPEDAVRKVSDAIRSAKPYLDSGVAPPVGIDPLIDQIHKDQTKADLRALDDAFSEAQKSATKERSPEVFANFIREHTDARIGISAEGVQALYGDKLPEAGDGKLGWIPDIERQYNVALAGGGDIEVPLADWLAKADPEVAKEVHDFLRVRPGGLTAEEAKAPLAQKEVEEEPQPVEPVDAVRQASRLEPTFEPSNLDRITQAARARETQWHIFSSEGGKDIAYALPKEEWTSKEDRIVTALSSYLKSIAPKFNPERVVATRGLELGGEPVLGLYQGFYDAEPLIFYALHNSEGQFRLPENILGTVRHEAIHYLYRNGFFTPEEWSSLTKAAEEQDWIGKHDVAGRYEGEHQYLLEEAIAHEFQEWNLKPRSTHIAADVFLRMREALLKIAEKVKAVLGFDSKVEDIFHRIESGEIGGREPTGAPEAAGPAAQVEDPFEKAAAIGMTRDQYERYLKLIERRNAEDAEHQAALGRKRAEETQTKEWKENESNVHASVAADVRNRPDIAADLLLRDGTLFGRKVGRVRLDADALTAEQRKGLPDDYYGPGGINPDEAAGLFGYQSGDALVGALSRLEQERRVEGLTPAAHLTKLINVETERQMRRQFGTLEDSILEEAKDHVLGQTQLDLLHEEMVALGTKAGGQTTISKADLQGWVKQEFDRTPIGRHSTDKYLAAAGRAGTKAEQALLEERPQDAFKAKQEQYISILLAREAKRLEKQRGQFDRLAKRFSRREVAGVPPEYTNWVHDILMRTGNVVRRSIQDLQEAIGRETSGTLEAFTHEKNYNSAIWEQDENAPSDFQQMPVAPFLFDPNYRRQVDDMSPEEFRAVHNSVKTIIKNGQEENKVTVAGEKQDLRRVVDTMVEQLDSILEKKSIESRETKGFTHVVKTAWASLLQIESIFNRFDRGNPKGIFRKAITGPIFEGSNSLNTLETKYSKLYKGVPNFPNKKEMRKLVSNPFFKDDPTDSESDFRTLTRGHILSILQNVGNAGQLDKLARGYRIEDKDALMRWLFSVTTKEDWDRAQALGDIFEKAFEESAQMYHSLSGVSPEKIDLRPIQTPFGEYRGWYHPIVYDPIRPGTSRKLMGPNPLEDGSYYRAATPSGYTKRRTGYAAPIQLSFDFVPARLKTMLNDIAMRPVVTQVAKVFYDPKFQTAITRYYGKEVKDLLIPYLKDITGQKQYKDAAQSTALRVLEAARQNLTATLIGLNPTTVAKHAPTAAMLSIKEVGAVNFLNEVRQLFSMNDELGERNWSFAMRESEELQRRHRNWQETLTGAQADVFGENTLRNSVIKFGATPVAFSDLLSAVPTWLAAYKAQVRDGVEHGDAVTFANTAVRRAHGSSAIAARPRVMRGGALAQFATPFYTFFNEMFQRQYEMAWRAKDALGEFSEGNYREGLKEVPNLMGGLWAYVVFPALIEQMVSPIVTGNEPSAVKAVMWGGRTIASSLPIVRDLAEAFLGGHDPSIGLYSTAAKMATDVFRDVGKGEISMNKVHAGKTIRHFITLVGALTGLTNAQMGKTGEFVYDYSTSKQVPRSTGDIIRGLWTGNIKEQRR